MKSSLTGADGSPARLITSSTLRTDTGRRRYYDQETASQSDGSNTNRTCPNCGKTRKGTGVLCRKCWYQARAEVGYLTLRCSQCGQPFRLMRAEDEKKRRNGQDARLCSIACRTEWLKTFNVRTVCPQCGNRFGGGQGRKYCGPECLKAARDARRKRRDCPHCGESFTYSSERRQYCTRACANAAHSLRMVGVGNSRYKDGTSYAEWFRLMKPLIRERDSDACVACGVVNVPIQVSRQGLLADRSGLVVHHINEDPRDNRPENLITLCMSCHLTHHKSSTTPYPWFGDYAANATRSMTSRWRATTTSLQAKFSSTTA